MNHFRWLPKGIFMKDRSCAQLYCFFLSLAQRVWLVYWKEGEGVDWAGKSWVWKEYIVPNLNRNLYTHRLKILTTILVNKSLIVQGQFNESRNWFIKLSYLKHHDRPQIRNKCNILRVPYIFTNALNSVVKSFSYIRFYF